MKKIRLMLLSAAVLLAAGAVMATRPAVDCDNRVNYYKVGDKFYLAGQYGVDYTCTWDHWGTCTYYYDSVAGVYKPCRDGKIIWIR